MKPGGIFTTTLVASLISTALPARADQGLSARCEAEIGSNTGAWAIDLNHQFPRSRSQGYNGTCYMYSLMGTVSAALYRKQTGDHRLRGPESLYSKDFEYSPELTLLLLALMDPQFLEDRLQHAEDRAKNKAPRLGLFDSGRAAVIFPALQRNPEALVPLDLWTKATTFRDIDGVIVSALEGANPLHGHYDDPSYARSRVQAAIVKILKVMEKKPDFAPALATLKRNGFSWDTRAEWVQFHRNSSKSLGLKSLNLRPKTHDVDACQRMIDRLFKALCKGIPAVVDRTENQAGFNWIHSAIAVGTLPIGRGNRMQRTDLMIRDSARLDSESDKFNPHTGIVGYPLSGACEHVIDRFGLFETTFILTDSETL